LGRSNKEENNVSMIYKLDLRWERWKPAIRAHDEL